VTKAKAENLNLDRMFWGMRKANEPRPPGKEGGARSRAGEGRTVTGPRHWNPTG